VAGILESLTLGLTITHHSDWLTFVARLDRAIHSGRVRKVPVLKPVWGGKSEQWFLDPEDGEVYFYVPPNPPTLPRWEKVDVLKHLEAGGWPNLP